MLAVENTGSSSSLPFALRGAFRAPRIAPETPARGGLAPWQEQGVRRHVRDNIDTDLNVAILAGIARLSKSYFNRAFQVSFGCTPREYVLGQRIATAKAMMQDSGKALSEIALDCGFCDQPHLSRVFRDFTGMTPLRWRRSQSAAA
ncbi:helix-turn-helix domain-containing protein [Lacibacterium aquatile]|uniref:Helix-turn-helix domain-containing protein n=1 Tax=Lacibacterium aquatile TaxID=1168082 RepID=A0ABW5DX29_9PROT